MREGQVWLSRRKRGTSTSCSADDWLSDVICPASGLRHHVRQLPRQILSLRRVNLFNMPIVNQSLPSNEA